MPIPSISWAFLSNFVQLALRRPLAHGYLYLERALGKPARRHSLYNVYHLLFQLGPVDPVQLRGVAVLNLG